VNGRGEGDVEKSHPTTALKEYTAGQYPKWDVELYSTNIFDLYGLDSIMYSRSYF